MARLSVKESSVPVGIPRRRAGRGSGRRSGRMLFAAVPATLALVALLIWGAGVLWSGKQTAIVRLTGVAESAVQPGVRLTFRFANWEGGWEQTVHKSVSTIPLPEGVTEGQVSAESADGGLFAQPVPFRLLLEPMWR